MSFEIRETDSVQHEKPGALAEKLANMRADRKENEREPIEDTQETLVEQEHQIEDAPHASELNIDLATQLDDAEQTEREEERREDIIDVSTVDEQNNTPKHI